MGLLLGLFCYQKLSIFEEKLCVFVNCIGNSADPILDLTTRNDFSFLGTVFYKKSRTAIVSYIVLTIIVAEREKIHVVDS